jgi:hypothetical protein
MNWTSTRRRRWITNSDTAKHVWYGITVWHVAIRSARVALKASLVPGSGVAVIPLAMNGRRGCLIFLGGNDL